MSTAIVGGGGGDHHQPTVASYQPGISCGFKYRIDIWACSRTVYQVINHTDEKLHSELSGLFVG